ncbi:hypothetical protein X975_20497, partial [Stegodyphus mimosarum]
MGRYRETSSTFYHNIMQLLKNYSNFLLQKPVKLLVQRQNFIVYFRHIRYLITEYKCIQIAFFDDFTCQSLFV